jgi:deoxyhypusine synthase
MLQDPDCTIILTVAGSTSAAGCMQIYVDLLRHNMVDIVVATGATVVDMDFFEALGFSHYRGTQFVDDGKLRDLYIDRIYDTFIDEEDLQHCDRTIKEIADGLQPRPYSSREFIAEMGRWLRANPTRAVKTGSLVQVAHEQNVPVFCPAFSDSSAGFGLVAHQAERPDAHVSIDSVRDFRELTELKIRARHTGLLMVGGGSPKNFAQDTVVCAEILGQDVPMHKYSVQITVADVRDGACSSSSLKEASSWGKVESTPRPSRWCSPRRRWRCRCWPPMATTTAAGGSAPDASWRGCWLAPDGRFDLQLRPARGRRARGRRAVRARRVLR